MTKSRIVLQLCASVALICSSTGNIFASELGRTPMVPAATLECDVVLQDGGLLHGQIVNEQGLAQGNTKVLLLQHRKPVAVSQTNRDGRFNFSGLTPGVYQIDTSFSTHVCRVWAQDAAPPVAKNGMTIVTSSEVVRGQLLNQPYRTAVRGAIGGGLLTGGVYWALDNNPPGS